MATLNITSEDFSSVVETHPIVVLDFWATWCGPCKSFAPIFEAASETHPDIVFGKIDTDSEAELAEAFSIRSVPTLMVLRDKILVYRESGAMPASSFEQLIAQVRALDMDAVRAEIAAQEGAADSN